jgi:hypothetical protein
MERKKNCEEIFYEMLGELSERLGTQHRLRVKNRVSLDKFTSNYYRSFVPYRLSCSAFDIDLWTDERGFDLYLVAVPKFFRIRIPLIRPTICTIAYPDRNPPGSTINITDLQSRTIAPVVCQKHISKMMNAAAIAIPKLNNNPILISYRAAVRTAKSGVRDGLRSDHNY